jgi:hypothetical protein
MHTDTVAAVFTCTHCEAVPELVVTGNAQLSIVRHKLGCPTLMAQARAGPPINDQRLYPAHRPSCELVTP